MYKRLNLNKHTDLRGGFIKIFDGEDRFVQSFITKSEPMVFRGFHFYKKNNSCDRLLFVINGELNDILIDLRSDHFGSIYKIKLFKDDAVIIPSYCAHGFYTESGCELLYFFKSNHDPTLDTTVRYELIDSEIKLDNYTISEKDRYATALDFNLHSF